MRNYCKAGIMMLISIFVIACTKTGDNLPNASKTQGSASNNTKPIAADTTKSKPAPPVTTKPDTTKPVTTPKPPVTTPPVTTTPVTTTPKPVTTPPVTTKPVTTPPVTSPPVTTTPKPPVTTPPGTTTPTPSKPVTPTPVKPVTVPPVTTTPKPVKPVASPPVATTPKPTTPVVKAPSYKLSAPIEYIGKSNITISGDSINGGASPCIYLINCTNIHITRCKLVNSTNFGVYLNNCSNILVDSSYIANVRAGVYAEVCPLGQIRVQYNQMRNMQGPYPHADFVQFDRVNGSNNRIIGNKMENVQGQSNPEDAINLYMCNGSPSDPILVSGNSIRGGGPSTTGAGITVGDQGGSYQTIQNNTVVNSGYGGIDFAGGTHIQIINNTIFSTSFPWSGCGLGCSNFSNAPASNNTITNNKVNWIAGHWGGYRRDTVYRAGSGNNINPAPAGWKANIVAAPININILPSILIDFK